MTLQQLQDYWKKKYPTALVSLWKSHNGNQYYGMIMAKTADTQLAAETMGELIAQGEDFLRRTK